MDYSLLLGFVPLTSQLRTAITLDDDAPVSSPPPSSLRRPMRERKRRSVAKPTSSAAESPAVAVGSAAAAAASDDDLSRPHSLPTSASASSSTPLHDMRSSANEASVIALRSAINIDADADADVDVDVERGADDDDDDDAHAGEFVVGSSRSRNGRWLLRSRDGRSLYVFGIIDMLQLYNAQKKLERFVKVRVLCKDRDGISVQTPPTYAKRFLFRISTLSTGRLRSPVEYRTLARKSISLAPVNP